MGNIAIRVATLTILVTMAGCGGASKQLPDDSKTAPDLSSEDEQREIPEHADVAVFVLAHCPYAAEAIRSLVSLKREMGHALSLSVGFIGLLDANGKPDPKMGTHEIETAKLHICTATVSRQEQWLNYLDCVFEHDRWRSMPNGFSTCADLAGVKKQDVKECIASGKGDELLTRAYEVSVETGILGSPTLIVGNNQYLGDYSLASLERHICFETGKPDTRPGVCDQIEPLPPVAATLLQDSRCVDPDMCDISRELALLEQIIPGLELNRLDYVSKEGRRMFDLIQKTGSDVKDLPLIILDAAVANNPGAMARLKVYLSPFGDGYLIALGNGWNPTDEICDNEIDDTDNDKIDCDDPTCAKKAECRPHKKKRLDLFVMSECPYFWDLVPRISAVLDHFGKKRGKIDFNLQFIGDVEDDEFTSMHGESEVAEDLRMICAEELWGKGYRFMEYVECRVKALDSNGNSFEECVPNWMSLKRLKRCAEGEQGAKLLKQSFELAEQLGIGGSPSWLLNNHLPMEGRTPQRIVESYCKHNSQDDCDKEITKEPEPDFEKMNEKCL